jgi:hypothetical protein
MSSRYQLWQFDNESPWFKGFKLYRQNRDKNWSQALDDLKMDLNH